MTVDVEIEGLGLWVCTGVREAAHGADHGEYGREWIDGRVGGEERDMNDGCGVENGVYGLKVVLGSVAETTNGAAFVIRVGGDFVHGGQESKRVVRSPDENDSSYQYLYASTHVQWS